MLQGFHVSFLRLFQQIQCKITLFAQRDNLIKRILEKHAFQPVSHMPRRLLARPRPRFVDIALRTQNPQRQSVKQRFCSRNREVRRVIGKRPDLVRQTYRSPGRMHPCRYAVKRMMNIDGEIQ